MRVYYYTSEQHGLSNIINKRIKISLLNELNDPFEFLGVDLSDKEFREAFKAGRDAVAKESVLSASLEVGIILYYGHTTEISIKGSVWDSRFMAHLLKKLHTTLRE